MTVRWRLLVRVRPRPLLLTLGVLLAALLGLEGGLRLLLFGRQAWIQPIAARFRNELRYASALEDDCWKLRALFHESGGRAEHTFRDERLGWTNEDIEPGTLRHRAELPEDGRKLVLLYGDSFARCATERVDAWEGLLARSELGESHVLLNFGVAGYGLDQIYLMLAATIDRYQARDPIVVVGILVEDDLERTSLSLRNFPKPHFELVDSELVLHPVRTRTAAEFIASDPLGIRSYLWRLAVHSRFVPADLTARLRGEQTRLDACRARCLRILEETQRLLVERRLAHFVLLFHAERALDTIGPCEWQESFLYETLHGLGMPFVSSKRALLEDMAATGRATSQYFGENRHYSAGGNAAVFPALARGIRGEFEPAEGYLPGAPSRPGAER